MKMSKKLMIAGVVLAAVLGGVGLYTTFNAPLPTVEEVEAAKKVELATAVELATPDEAVEADPYDYTIEYTPEEPEEEIPEEFLPSVTETVNDDGSMTIDRTWGVKPDGAVTVDDPDGADANMASGGGEIPLDENGVYQGEQHEESTVTEPVEPEESTSDTTSYKTGDTRVDENGQTWSYIDIGTGVWALVGEPADAPVTYPGGGAIIENAY